MTPQERLRWTKIDGKTICERFNGSDWVEHQYVNETQSRFFHESPDEPNLCNIRFKGISDTTHRER